MIDKMDIDIGWLETPLAIGVVALLFGYGPVSSTLAAACVVPASWIAARLLDLQSSSGWPKCLRGIVYVATWPPDLISNHMLRTMLVIRRGLATFGAIVLPFLVLKVGAEAIFYWVTGNHP